MFNPTTTLNEWVVARTLSPNARFRLFCFPYAGGSSLIFRIWDQHLPQDIEVIPVELPGRGTRLRERPEEYLLPMVGKVGKAILPFLNKPFGFFGHSMGALIAFELARYLRRLGMPLPEKLLLSAHRAPHLPTTGKVLHALPESEFIEELRSLNGTPEEIIANSELMQLLIPVLRADFKACETYTFRFEPPLNCPISVFGGMEDQNVSRDDLEAWKMHTESSFALHLLPGDHFFIQKNQHMLLKLVAKELSETLTLLEK